MRREYKFLIVAFIILIVILNLVTVMVLRGISGKTAERPLTKQIESQKELIEILKEPSKHEDALKMLRGVPRHLAIDTLTALSLKSTDIEVKKSAFLCIVELGIQEGIHALTIGSRDSIPEVRIAAIKALSAFPQAESQAAIAEALQDQIYEVKKSAAEALSKLSNADEATVPGLIKTLNEDSEQEIRKLCAIALGKRSSEKAREALITALNPENQTDVSVRIAAFDSLLAIEDKFKIKGIVCATCDPEENIKNRALSILSTFTKEQLKPLIDAVCSREFSSAISREKEYKQILVAIIKLFESIGEPETIDGLMGILKIALNKEKTDNSEIITQIAEVASKFGEKSLKLLSDVALKPWVSLSIKKAISKAFINIGVPAVKEISDYIRQWQIIPSEEEANLWIETLEKIGGKEAEVCISEVNLKKPSVALKTNEEQPLHHQEPDYNLHQSDGLNIELEIIMKEAVYVENLPIYYARRSSSLPWLKTDTSKEEKQSMFQPKKRTDLKIELACENGKWKRIYGWGLNKGHHFGKVDKAIITDNEIKLSIRMGVGKDPWLMGGYGEYEIELKPIDSRTYEGSYIGKYHDISISGYAIAKIKPPRSPVKATWRPVKPNEHPRMLLRIYELPRLKAKLSTKFGQIAFKRMVESHDPICLGLAYQLTDNQNFALEAIALEKAEMAKRDFGFMGLGQIWGPRLTTIALTYDLCYNAWPKDFIQEVQSYLLRISSLTSTDMGKFSSCANWSEDSNYFSPIQGGGAMLALAYWMDPGPPPVLPGGTEIIEVNQTITNLYSGTVTAPLIDKKTPLRWLWTGPIFEPVTTEEFFDAIKKERVLTNNIVITILENQYILKEIPSELIQGDGIVPWFYLKEIKPDWSVVSFLLHTIIENEKEAFYLVKLPPQGITQARIGDKYVSDESIVKLNKGFYPVFLAHNNDSNALTAINFVLSFISDDPEEIRKMIELNKIRLKREYLWYELDSEEYRETGMDGQKIRVFHQCINSMYRNARKLMGDGGYQSEGEGYTHTADTPVKFHVAYLNMFGRPLSPYPDATHFPFRYMVTSILQEPANKKRLPTLFMQPFNAGHGIGSGIEFMILGFPLIPDEYKPGVLWIWNKINRVDPLDPESVTNIIHYCSIHLLPYAFLHYPLDMKPLHPSECFPLTYQCISSGLPPSGKGLLMFRNRWQDSDDIVFQIYAREETGGGWSQQNAGAIRLYGFGREWARNVSGRGAERWLDSVVLLPENLTSDGATGKIVCWKADPKTGNGYVTIDLSNVYKPLTGKAFEKYQEERALTAKALKVTIDQIPEKKADPNIKGIRAIAVDYSKKSGADALIVMIDKIEGGGMRQWLWHLPAESDLKLAVDESSNSFTATQNNATLKCTFIAPAKPVIHKTNNVKEFLKMPELARAKAEQSPGFVVDAIAGESYFAIITLQKGNSPEVKVISGNGLESTVKVGETIVRFDGQKVVIE